MPDSEVSSPRRNRILVADDEPHIRRILATILESGGFVVDQVGDGAAAMERLSGEVPYEMALLDLMMPGLTGLQVLEKIPLLPHRDGLAVVILTAKGQDADREAAFRLGARDFMTKPFSPKKLLARIRQLLDAS
ncbi:MAG: response regulator transcription factor [Gemmatimonadota bacterium]|jgi:two-component system alkaline phosphatase synthesis response regulator PhoP